MSPADAPKLAAPSPRGAPSRRPPRWRNLRPLLLVWLLTATWSGVPYLVATLRPPPGLAFVGAFYYADDFYNYLSYAQQAEDGAFLFRNKVLRDDHRPALVNLEWYAVGRLAFWLGGRLVLAYRLFGLLAAAGFLLACDRWFQKLGGSETHRLPALLLLTTGGGLGGLLFAFTSRTLPECVDLYAGLFPFLGLLANPHFVAGLTLLLWGLLLLDGADRPRDHLLALLVATALALVRPYDLVLLVLIRGMAVLLLDPPSRWLRGLVPLLGLLPVVGYLYWLFYLNPAFAFYAGTPYTLPEPLDFVWALGPAALLGLAGALGEGPVEGRRARIHLLAWCLIALVPLVFRPVNFSFQFLVGVGFPLLALGSMALVRWRPALAAAAVVAFSTSLVVAVRFVLTPNPLWLTPRENLEIVSALRPTCRRGDLVFSPPEVGLFASGLTACQAFVSHRIAPDYAQRLAELGAFASASPPERRALLDRARVTHLVLPGDAGTLPESWLGPEPPFAVAARVGTPPRLSLYLRRVDSARKGPRAAPEDPASP